MKIALTTLLIAVTFTVRAQCSFGINPRPDWRSLDNSQKQLFLSAMLTIQQRSADAPSLYDQFVQLHITWAPVVHGYAVFLPWHRYFISLIENELQMTAQQPIMLPYWDWNTDSQSPERSTVWGDDDLSFGRNGDRRGCVSTGAFRNFVKLYPNGGGCLDRNFANGNRLPPFVDTNTMDTVLQQSTSFDALRFQLETPHGVVHNAIGGSMIEYQSPNDPIFYLHHANVDRLWDRWQMMYPALAATYNGNAMVNGFATLAQTTDILAPYPVPVWQIFDTRALCYFYPVSSRGVLETPVSLGRRKTQIKVPGKLPSDWIKRNNLDETAVRRFEAKVEQIIKATNSQGLGDLEDAHNELEERLREAAASRDKVPVILARKVRITSINVRSRAQ